MLLSVEDLRVSYGNIKALHGLDFQIDEGEIVLLPAPLAPMMQTISPSSI